MSKQLPKLMILVLVLSLTAGSAYAASAPAMQWHQAYNGSGEESHPHYVIETSDGGFLMVGETGFIPNSAKIYVVKTNSSGGLLWQKEFGSSGYNLGNGCVETPDGNYVIAGTLNYDAVLIKVNASTGNTLSGWPKTWNLGTEDSFEAVENTQDGGLLATGYRDGLAESTFINWGKGNLIKTDADGNQIWNKDISAYMHSGYRIVRISDGYMVSGHPATEGQPDYTLMKFDFDGNVVWYKTPHPEIYWGFDVAANGNMILSGHGASPLSNNIDIITVQVDSAGNHLWTEYAGQPRGYNGDYIHDEVWGARATPDGGWILTAGSGDEYAYSECGHPLGCSDQWIVYCLKYSSSGTLEWEGLYGGAGDWAGEDVCMTSDGGALVANDCGAFGFLKLEPFSGAPDTDPPTPDPMTWQTVPYATGDSSIAMVATTASDPSGVEYYFSCISSGGHDSLWQNDTFYEDTGLLPDTSYTYTTKARDKSVNQNQTAESTAESATTDPADTTPPSPDPMTWASVPAAVSSSAIEMTATTASDPSGVEYYFMETSANPGGSDSGWQDSTGYTDTGLNASTQYCYEVQARDKSVNQNLTGWSTNQCATTQAGGGTWIKVDDRDASVTYAGSTWYQTNPSTAYMNTATYTQNMGITATYSFTGTQVRFYVWQYDTSQGYDVYIDEQFQQTVNISAGSEASIQAWESGTLTNTAHALKLVTASGEPHVDAFEHLTGGAADTDPPTPDPMTWASVPTADDHDSISMTATTATDASGVEYFFDETSGNPGGSDSGWQDGTSYTDTGLSAETQYCYQVKARDKSTNQNETAWSTNECATTQAAPAWTQIIYDDFEGGFGNWVDGGTDCILYTEGTYAHQGNNAVDLQDNTSTSVMTTANLALSSYDEVKVDFWYYPVSFDSSSEDFWLQISTNGGSSFDTVEEWNLGDEFENGNFYPDSVIITGYTLTDQTQVRFRCDASGNGDDVYIDEVYVYAGGGGPPDTDPPTPDPMTWASVPAADDHDSISMTATTATDESGVEYYFDETSGNPGGSDSGWQDGTGYTDTGLSAETQYCYQVKARDKSANQNETAYSTNQCATTEVAPDTTPPSPDPMTWASVPAAGGTDNVSMTATTASDPSGVEYYFDETTGNPGGSDSGWQDGTGYNDTGLSASTQYCYRVQARDKSVNQNATAWSSTECATTDAIPDTDPPTPDPMTWQTVPYSTGTSSIAMTATTATDPSGVEYYFDETSGNPGGSDSGWQDSTSYTDIGLSASTQYCYRVQARDKSTNQNATAWSTTECATTEAEDTTPPTPDPMTWASVPAAGGTDNISMTATTASDPSGVEYFFDETSGNAGGTDSGWQDSTSYTDIGLSAGTQYCYQVTARDKSVNQNTTAASTNECATTEAPDTTPPSPDPMTWSSVPSADSDTAISMTATTASDPSGVQYYFDETSGNSGGSDSSWQSPASYTDSGLSAETQYCYQVKARDQSPNQNETAWSTNECATTQAKSDCGAAPMYRDGVLANATVMSSFGHALLPLIPSLLTLGLWTVIRRKRD